MNKTNNILASTKGMSKLERAKFGPGMLLMDEDLEQLNSYTRDLSRLLFKSFFGCGVICGLVVTVNSKCGKVCVTVGAGVALACSGDPVAVPTAQTFPLDENCDPDIKSPLWVVLYGTTKQCAKRYSTCASDDDEALYTPTRDRDGFEIRVVRKRPDCACGCEENGIAIGETDCKCVKPYQPNKPGTNCYDSHYDGKCGCNCDECSDCDCKCILLAQLIKNEGDNEHPWYADHRVRRFIRPVLMRDPQAEIEETARKEAKEKAQYAMKLAVVDKDREEAYRLAAVVAEAADRAEAKAKEDAAVKADKLAVAKAAANQAAKAKVAADKAKAAADKAAGGDKPAANNAAALAKQAAALAKQAATEADKTAAEAENATTVADAAAAAARKAEDDRTNAYKAAKAATEKAARLMKE